MPSLLQFIIKSLTVENVPFEVFSTFSGAFEEVRKVGSVAGFTTVHTDSRRCRCKSSISSITGLRFGLPMP